MEQDNILGFPLYVVDVPGRFDRAGIYSDPDTGLGYQDEFERALTFQVAVLEWIRESGSRPDIIHCHDHHTGLVPFMMTRCNRYDALKLIPTVLTVHNGEYHGVYAHTKDRFLPAFDPNDEGLLDWSGKLNCLAAGLKCCWQITTVSSSYLEELAHKSNGLEWLFDNEKQKSAGIINGIDTSVWDPETDPDIPHHYSVETMETGKAQNKQSLCEQLELDSAFPVFSFIGRLAYEKGADLLPDLFRYFLEDERKINFILLGTGDPVIHEKIGELNRQYADFFKATLAYDETLAHRMYAGSDFLIMPSRTEPCGLNQMYSMRYGTIPVVRNVGGLKDTVRDVGEKGGYGFTFDKFNLDQAVEAVDRAARFYADRSQINLIRKKIMKLDFSWNASSKEYIEMYKSLLAN